MSNYDGCPYKVRNIGTNNPYCPFIRKDVPDFVMCDCDWESCPEYQEQRKQEEAEYIKQFEDDELDIIYKGLDKLIGVF